MGKSVCGRELEEEQICPVHGIARRRRRRKDAALTDSQVREVRRLLAADVPQPEIGARFGVDRSVISKIKTGRKYANVPAEV